MWPFIYRYPLSVGFSIPKFRYFWFVFFWVIFHVIKKKMKLNNQYNKINHQANMRLTDKSISDKERALWTAVAKRCDNDRESAMELKQMKFDGVQIY